MAQQQQQLSSIWQTGMPGNAANNVIVNYNQMIQSEWDYLR